MSTPNLLYVHSHDTGRYVQPYGYQVPTPNIQHLADQGVLFRQAFCAAPVCSGSRAALLTGQSTHATGMLGLAHRGWRLTHPERHIVHPLRAGGYWTGLVGEQHVSASPQDLGYDWVADIDSTRASDVVPAARRAIARRAKEAQPFFLSVGFFETHREYFEPTSVRDSLYSRPPEHLVDNAATRRDMAAFKSSARSLDQALGAVLDSLEEHGLADTTLVVFTTDHGLAVPDAKCTMSDRGTGVLLIVRGPGGFERGRVSDGLVSHLDVYPTLCELAGIEAPHWAEGHSLVPLVNRQVPSLRDEVFAEVTYHAAYEPQRSVRTDRYRYLKRYDDTHAGRVLANVDDSPTKDVMVAAGWGDVEPPAEALYDLTLDPTERVNRIEDPRLAGVLADLRGRLQGWMEGTGDPLLDGPVTAPEGTFTNTVDQRSPSEPTTPATDRSMALTQRARRPPEPGDGPQYLT